MDLYHIFGNDLQLNLNGDLLTVDGDELSKQRILRRLLTAIKGYIWHATYGAGLPQYIGQNFSSALERRLKGNIKTQMFLEETVAQSPEPQITLNYNGNTINCVIIYTSKSTGKVFTLSFTVGDS